MMSSFFRFANRSVPLKKRFGNVTRFQHTSIKFHNTEHVHENMWHNFKSPSLSTDLHKQQSSRNIRGVVLDFSGTLIDPGVFAPAVVFRKIFHKFGVPITMEEARKPMGNHKKVHIRKITENKNVAQRWMKKHGSMPTSNDIDALFKEFIPAQIDILPQYTEFIPGVLGAVTYMKYYMGLQLGSTTGFTRDMVDVITKKMKQEGLELDFTVAADEVPNPRPYPDACFVNMIFMGINNPNEVVKIGDTEMDMQEGRDANMWTIGLVKYSNLVGKLPEEIKKMEMDNPIELYRKYEETAEKLGKAGANIICMDMQQVPMAIDLINRKIANNQKSYDQDNHYLIDMTPPFTL